ncbi:MAG: sialate O-acetylesterase [Verrucomicrobium sp.]|nr:sialate O-acetylesterase [Verrucomicrobium sp.]
MKQLLRIAAAVLLLAASPAWAALRLPALFADHMVLQAGAPAAVWGWADPGAEVTVTFSGQEPVHAAAGSDGRWKAALPALDAGARGTLAVESKGTKKEIADVLAGQVWLCSGQSNMEYNVDAPASRYAPREKEVDGNVALAHKEAAPLEGAIRYFQVTRFGADAPQDDVKGSWIVVTPENVGECSAVAWNFALRVHDALRQPVGLILSTWGGTPVQSWLPREALDATSVAADIWKHHAELIAQFPAAKKKYDADLAAWKAANPTPELQAENKRKMPRMPYYATCSLAPVRLYNGMIHGLAPYTLSGFLWYQGEADGKNPTQYAEQIRALVNAWRKDWEAELPFFYVELAGCGNPPQKPAEGGTAYIREAQAGVLQLPKTGVAIAVDLGLPKNIHPPFKKEVGNRLAGLALEKVYGQRVGGVDSPQFEGFAVEGNSVRLKFTHAEGLRAKDGGPLKGFALRGAHGDWVWGDARIDGQDIVVSSPSVSAPAAVRYGWASYPTLSVENAAGLPLRPFRTDPETPDAPAPVPIGTPVK